MTYEDPTVTEQINDYLYTSSKFPALTQLRLLGRVTKVLGERGVQALFAILFKDAKLGVAPGRYSAAIVQVAYGLAEDSTLVRDLLEKTKVNRYRLVESGGLVTAQFDSHFQGELPHLLNVLMFVLKHNFMGFTQGFLLQSGSPTSEKTGEVIPSGSPSPSAV